MLSRTGDNSHSKNLKAIEIGVRLKKIRKAAGLSLNNIAERLNNEYGANINKGMISKYENGIHEPSASMIFCLGRILGVSSEYLLGKCDEPAPCLDIQGTDTMGYSINIYNRYNLIDGGDKDLDSIELIPKSWLTGGRDYVGIRINDNRFSPRLYDGDLIIFEKKNKSAKNLIMLICIDNNDAFPCLIEKKRDGKWIIPLEIGSERVFYSTDELIEHNVKIIGSAVQIRRYEDISIV